MRLTAEHNLTYESTHSTMWYGRCEFDRDPVRPGRVEEDLGRRDDGELLESHTSVFRVGY